MDQEIECLARFKSLIAADDSLDNLSPILSDRFLIHFVRGRRYDSQRAYDTLLGYVNIRRGKYKDWFKTIQPSVLKNLFLGNVRVLKHRDPLNRVVVLGDFASWDTVKLPLDINMKIVMMIVDELMNFEDAEKNGVVVIFDMAKFGFQHAKTCTPFSFSKSLQLFWKNVPLRYIAVHMVNVMPLFTKVFNLLKHILPKKFIKRLYLQSSSYELLHADVLQEFLPISLGGKLTNEEAFDDEFDQRMFRKDDYYKTFGELL